ncbi:Na+/H+ antiporter [Mycobacterium sp. MYCO198283]|uniref:Na+/H+ antiporter n=1 Tax=Mycobacterium sp. MYCO198283 TaxID=2883505 RepID=UPI001E4F257F|nr:Na+/H+ antiporter [Mycobacterium sp. MYCO198283]MCG5430843.1 Na+/H+ antiporter [Mycobacterium sp. MYCO198283]
MAGLTLFLGLVAATIVLAPLAQRLTLPYPVVLLIFGVLLAFVPGVPTPSVDPELILPLVLPPLLFAAARRTSWRQFLDNRRPIAILAVALVLVTAFAVGVVLQQLVPGLPLVAALALGAAVGPPDAVAATAVAQRLKLPRRLRTILEGEGLSNDATALVLYDVAVASTLTGAFSPGHAGLALAVAIGVGVAVGLVVAGATRILLGKLPPHPAGSALVLVMPFVAYAAADAAHGSGVLAVVTIALALSRYGDVESTQTRLVAGNMWEILELTVTGVAFAFVGLEVRAVAQQVPGPLTELVGQSLIVLGVVVGIRIFWMFVVGSIDERAHQHRTDEAEPHGWRELAITSWAGMRGVVTLAMVLSLPMGPQPFPERERLIFIAFVVIIGTVVVQGLTLPFVVKALGVSASDDDIDDTQQQLIRRARDAGLQRLDEVRQRSDVDDDTAEHARENAERMWHSLGYRPHDGDGRASDEHATTTNALKEQVLEAARNEVVNARSEKGMDPTIVDQVLRRLDSRGSQPE